MDPTEDRMNPKALERVARTLFWAGFAALPWLWLANYFLLRPYLARRSTPRDVHWFATRSLWLSIAAAFLLAAWYVSFLVLRSRSASLTSSTWDSLSLVVPKS